MCSLCCKLFNNNIQVHTVYRQLKLEAFENYEQKNMQTER